MVISFVIDTDDLMSIIIATMKLGYDQVEEPVHQKESI